MDQKKIGQLQSSFTCVMFYYSFTFDLCDARRGLFKGYKKKGRYFSPLRRRAPDPLS